VASLLSFFQRSLEVDVGKRFTLGAAALFLLGFLPMPFGSLATFLYFGLAIVSVAEVALRRVPFAFPAPTCSPVSSISASICCRRSSTTTAPTGGCR
jgi:hypothetical protein